MEYEKKANLGEFAKKGVDFKSGDTLVVASEGKKVEGQWGMQDIFLVKLQSGEEKNISFNQTTINGLIDAYGKESNEWIGKDVKAHIIKQNVSGKFIDVAYFSHPNAELTEDGFIMPGQQGEGEFDKEEIDIAP